MEKEVLQQLLVTPKDITKDSSDALQNVLAQYPYFQSAHALLLKSLYIEESKQYNQALKTTAAYTLDRDILFDFITSSAFTCYKPLITVESTVEIEDPLETNPAKSTSTVDVLLDTFNNQAQQESTTAVAENNTIETAETTAEELTNIEEKLEIGKPLLFSTEEKHSYTEWLKLTNFTPIQREEEKKVLSEQEKNISIIDKFIETNPRIVPSKKPITVPVNIELSTQENTSLMTETLAKIYLEQKKYQKAIQAYEILILKYPEKSSLFADQILNIKSLQQHNN